MTILWKDYVKKHDSSIYALSMWSIFLLISVVVQVFYLHYYSNIVFAKDCSFIKNLMIGAAVADFTACIGSTISIFALEYENVVAFFLEFQSLKIGLDIGFVLVFREILTCADFVMSKTPYFWYLSAIHLAFGFLFLTILVVITILTIIIHYFQPAEQNAEIENDEQHLTAYAT